MPYVAKDMLPAQRTMDSAWHAFEAGDVKPIEALTGVSAGYLSQKDWSERIEIANRFRKYSYPELENVTEAVRRQLALVAAWRWILRGSHIAWTFDNLVWDRSDLLATIIGEPYVLRIDPAFILKTWVGNSYWVPSTQQGMELPIPYEQRDALWPQLSVLQNLSFAARTVFVRAVTYAKADLAGLVECSRIGLNGVSKLESGLDELAALGLVTPDVAMSDLLRLVSLKDLKQFAFRHGLESHGYKYQLIENITKHVTEKEALTLLQAQDGQRYVRVLIHESDLLKQYLRSELGRFYWYLEWIGRVQWLGLPICEVAAHPPRRDNNVDPWSPWSEKAQAYLQDSWAQPEIRLIRSIWNAECDRIVEGLARKYGWAADALISDAIRSYLPPDQLRAFREAQVWHAWQNVFTYYGCARIVEMGIEVREPKVMSCAGCGSRFRESSVYPDLAQRVDYKIHFCCGCYEKALNGVDRDIDPQPPAAMLVGLKTLATTLAVVPTASFLQRTNLATLSDDKQIAVVKCLLAMPSYDAYVRAFGSWFKALVLAGVLEGEAQPLSRGTRCFADDGHICLSLSEKTIDDWLSAHGIFHEKEPYYPRHPNLNPTGRIRGDWRVGNTIIEYAGLMDEPDYFARIEAKRELAKETGLSLVVVEPKHILDLDGVLVKLQNEAG